jgi:hypothetical protein
VVNKSGMDTSQRGSNAQTVFNAVITYLATIFYNTIIHKNVEYIIIVGHQHPTSIPILQRQTVTVIVQCANEHLTIDRRFIPLCYISCPFFHNLIVYNTLHYNRSLIYLYNYSNSINQRIKHLQAKAAIN